MEVNFLFLYLLRDAILNSMRIKVSVFLNPARWTKELESCLEIDSDHFLTKYSISITAKLLTYQSKPNIHWYRLFKTYFYDILLGRSNEGGWAEAGMRNMETSRKANKMLVRNPQKKETSWKN
jgi:hypothetical protein